MLRSKQAKVFSSKLKKQSHNHIRQKDMENKYFVYEGTTLRAAQPKFANAMKYFGNGMTILKGDPDFHKIDLTKIANKLIFSEYRKK